jgi:hypothetical protein
MRPTFLHYFLVQKLVVKVGWKSWMNSVEIICIQNFCYWLLDKLTPKAISKNRTKPALPVPETHFWFLVLSSKKISFHFSTTEHRPLEKYFQKVLYPQTRHTLPTDSLSTTFLTSFYCKAQTCITYKTVQLSKELVGSVFSVRGYSKVKQISGFLKLLQFPLGWKEPNNHIKLLAQFSKFTNVTRFIKSVF